MSADAMVGALLYASARRLAMAPHQKCGGWGVRWEMWQKEICAEVARTQALGPCVRQAWTGTKWV